MVTCSFWPLSSSLGGFTAARRFLHIVIRTVSGSCRSVVFVVAKGAAANCAPANRSIPGTCFRQTVGQSLVFLEVADVSGPDSNAGKFNFRVVAVSSVPILASVTSRPEHHAHCHVVGQLSERRCELQAGPSA